MPTTKRTLAKFSYFQRHQEKPSKKKRNVKNKVKKSMIQKKKKSKEKKPNIESILVRTRKNTTEIRIFKYLCNFCSPFYVSFFFPFFSFFSEGMKMGEENG